MSDQFDELEEMTREFVEESLESLAKSSTLLNEIKINSKEMEIINDVFRCLHSIKGTAGMFGLVGISTYIHRVESALDTIRKGKQKPTQKHLELLIEAIDWLMEMLQEYSKGDDKETIAQPYEDFLTKIELSFDQQSPENQEPLLDQLKVWLQKAEADELLAHNDLFAELQMLIKNSGGKNLLLDGVPVLKKSNTNPEAAPGPLVESETSKEESEKKSNAIGSLRVDLASLDRVMNMIGELFYVDERIKHIVEANGTSRNSDDAQFKKELESISRDFDSILSKAYERMNDIRKVPVSQITRGLERVIRKLSKEQEKKIRVVIKGESLRLDRQIIETLHDPLVHLVRNAVDHGIELPKTREIKTKSEEALINISFWERDENVFVSIVDDGNGIDHEVIREKAISQGLIDPVKAKNLPREKLLEIIFQPGFSMAEKVSEISGRGVGMDVVLSNIRRVGGIVKINSEKGSGTEILVSIPKKESFLVDGLVMRIGKGIYMLPYRSVQRYLPWKTLQKESLLQKSFFVVLKEGNIPIVNVQCLDEERMSVPQEGILIENRDGSQCVLPVDEIVGRQKTLTQEIKYKLAFSDLFCGTFTHGNGHVGFIINSEAILNFVSGS